MNKYVIAFWSDHTGELLQEEVEAVSRVEAAVKYLQWEEHKLETMEAVEQLCANCDTMIHVLQIDKKNWKHYTTQGPEHVAPAFH